MVFQRGQRHIGRGLVQKRQHPTHVPLRQQTYFIQKCQGHGVRQIGPRQRALHRPAQISLRQSSRRGVHRRQRLRQQAPGGFEGGVHHLQPHETTPNLAPCANAVAHCQRFLVRGVKAEKAHGAGIAAVVHRHQQLAAAPQLDLARRHQRLNLRHLTLAHLAQARDTGLILVAQRQVQRQINSPHQPELLQRFLGRA